MYLFTKLCTKQMFQICEIPRGLTVRYEKYQPTTYLLTYLPKKFPNNNNNNNYYFIEASTFTRFSPKFFLGNSFMLFKLITCFCLFFRLELPFHLSRALGWIDSYSQRVFVFLKMRSGENLCLNSCLEVIAVYRVSTVYYEFMMHLQYFLGNELILNK